MPTHSRIILEQSADRIFHNAMQLFSYYAWITKIAPTLKEGELGSIDFVYFSITQNAVLDGYLINLRRLNEFFSKRRRNEERADDLRAYHFGFPQIGRFLDEPDMTKIHKRIAHATTQAIITNRDFYEIFLSTELALKHCFKFFEFLKTSFYGPENPKSKQLTKVVPALHWFWDSWCADVKRLKGSKTTR